MNWCVAVVRVYPVAMAVTELWTGSVIFLLLIVYFYCGKFQLHRGS